MGIKNNHEDVLHRIRVKLYPNYLPKVKGKYIARTDNEASLNIERICDAMKNRGGFTGAYENLVDNVKQFLDECAYQLCDGFALNLGYFSIHPNIGGTFNSKHEAFDSAENPISFRFRTRAALHKLVRHIAVDITGIADTNAGIEEYNDREEDKTNEIFVPGNMFRVTGNKIKVLGDDAECGIFFVSADDPDKAVRVQRIAENTASMVIGITPNVPFPRSLIEIRTRFTGSKNMFLKTPRILTGKFVLEKM